MNIKRSSMAKSNVVMWSVRNSFFSTIYQQRTSIAIDDTLKQKAAGGNAAADKTIRPEVSGGRMYAAPANMRRRNSLVANSLLGIGSGKDAGGVDGSGGSDNLNLGDWKMKRRKADGGVARAPER